MIDHTDVATLCALLASDRTRAQEYQLVLPRPGTPECSEIFLAAWRAYRHVTTELGRQRMRELGVQVRDVDALEAYVWGRQIPSYERWAETEALLRAGEWRE